MKPVALVLTVSLAANLGLAAWLYSRSTEAQERESQASRVASKPASPAAATPFAPSGETWTQLSEGDDRDFVARLRAEGFPPSLVRVLAVMKLNDRFAARRRALFGVQEAPPYWRSYSAVLPSELNDPEMRAKRRALENEYAAALKELLGDDAPAATFEDHQRRRGDFAGMSPDAVRKIQAINRDYAELNSAVREQMRGILFPEDQERLDLLEREKRADLASVLTAEELESYDLRAGATAGSVRQQLAVFDPSEAEFKALVKVQQAFEARTKGVPLSSDESRELREGMVAAVLTPERFADYQTTTSGSYPHVSPLVSQFNLPPSTTGEVIGIQRDISRRAIGVRNDASLTTEQRDAQLAVLAREATKRLTTSLGSAFSQYQGTPASGWLHKLPPPARRKNREIRFAQFIDRPARIIAGGEWRVVEHDCADTFRIVSGPEFGGGRCASPLF